MRARQAIVRAWLIWAGAFVVAGASVGALLALPPARQRQVGPVLLIAATLCLLAAARQLRHLPLRRHAQVAAPGVIGAVAFDGSCAGQRFSVLSQQNAPSEAWISDQAPGGAQFHLYVLVQVGDGQARYRYAPPDMLPDLE